MIPYDIARCTPIYEPYIYNSYIGDLVQIMPYYATKNLYTRHAHADMEELIKQNRVLAVVAKESPDTILAWFSGKSNELDYVHVKSPFRKQGLATVILTYAAINNEIILTRIGPKLNIILDLAKKLKIVPKIKINEYTILI
jgi:hypothetical protein